MPNQRNQKVLFVHVGSPGKKAPRILVMPMGLIALADTLAKNGFPAQVLHLNVEKALDPDFDLNRYIKIRGFGIVCFDLFWHFQARSVLAEAKKIKAALKDIFIALGGFTASYFHAEIMERCPDIDFLIRGDAEIPLLHLVRAISNKSYSALDSVPNLSWRRSNRLHHNAQRYTTPQKVFDRLDFAAFHLVRHHEACSLKNLLSKKFHLETLSGQTQKLRNKRPGVFFFNCGRGCLVNCSFCGGGSLAQRAISGRKGLLLMHPASALRQLQKAARFGHTWWMTDFFPHTAEDYYITLFEKIRRSGIELKTTFSCWHLPGEEFIDAFKKTFRPDSILEISPDSGSNRVRKINKGYYFDNDSLLKFLTRLAVRGIPCMIHFTAGLASEKMSDVEKTLLLIDIIKKLFPRFEIVADHIIMEPASPWFLNKQRHGVLSQVKGFEDFHADRARPINYHTRNLSKDEIIRCVKAIAARAASTTATT